MESHSGLEFPTPALGGLPSKLRILQTECSAEIVMGGELGDTPNHQGEFKVQVV